MPPLDLAHKNFPHDAPVLILPMSACQTLTPRMTLETLLKIPEPPAVRGRTGPPYHDWTDTVINFFV